MKIIDLFDSLFFYIHALITLENVIRVACIIIGLIYTYTKYTFKAIYLPLYLYDYDKDKVSDYTYDEILNIYMAKILILTIIEGFIVVVLLMQFLIGTQISVAISKSGFMI